MITLGRPSSKLEVLLGGAVTTLELPIVAHWVDINSADQSVQVIGENDLLTSGSNTVVAVPGPASGIVRTIKTLSIYNADSTGATVTVRYNNNGTSRTLVSVTLGVGSTLQYND